MQIAMREKDCLRRTEKENQALRAQLAKATADLEYVAMMADVDMDEDEEEDDDE